MFRCLGCIFVTRFENITLDHAGSTVCLSCLPTTYANTLGNLHFSSCYFVTRIKHIILNHAGSKICTSCPPGTYSNTTGNFRTSRLFISIYPVLLCTRWHFHFHPRVEAKSMLTLNLSPQAPLRVTHTAPPLVCQFMIVLLQRARACERRWQK